MPALFWHMRLCIPYIHRCSDAVIMSAYLCTNGLFRSENAIHDNFFLDTFMFFFILKSYLWKSHSKIDFSRAFVGYSESWSRTPAGLGSTGGGRMAGQGKKPWGGGGGGRGVVMETSLFLSSSSCATHKNIPYKEDLSIGTYMVYTSTWTQKWLAANKKNLLAFVLL